MTKSNRQGSVHPEAQERGLCVGTEGWRVINLAGLGRLVPHWVCSGGPLHQPTPAAAVASCSVCSKGPAEREMCRWEGKEAHHVFIVYLSLQAHLQTE